MRIVIIDDQQTGRRLLEKVVEHISPGVVHESFGNAVEALESCRETPPDLLITDYSMPGMDGIDLIRRFRGLPGCHKVPIIVVSIVDDRSVRHEALEAGATDFLPRPFDPYECQARCRNLLLLHRYQKETERRTRTLEREIKEATARITRREHETLLCLAKAGEFRDEGTGNHIRRMARYSVAIGAALGLPEETLDLLEYASPMHDIGKIGIPDAILLKPGRLTPAEREVIQQHTRIGHDILARSNSPYLQLAASIALSHHERWDGSGYPHGLSGERIPIEARIVAIADTLDALTTHRPYKAPWPLEQAIQYIRDHSGSQFDPACVSAFLSAQDAITDIHEHLLQGEGEDCCDWPPTEA